MSNFSATTWYTKQNIAASCNNGVKTNKDTKESVSMCGHF